MNDLRLDGKTALVTAGSKGIGRAIAAAFAQSGANVMISSRKSAVLAEAAEKIRASGAEGEVDFFQANAGEPDQAEACVAATMTRFSGIDILVNNAGTNPYFGPLMGLDVPRAEKTVKVNLTGPLIWTQLVWEASFKDRGGAVINTASLSGLSVELNTAWYAITKAAVVHLTKQLAAELAPSVRVNAIAPGLIKTDFARGLWEPNEEELARNTPLARLGEPRDVASAVLFLASDASSWITGHTIVIDGGAFINPLTGAGS